MLQFNEKECDLLFEQLSNLIWCEAGVIMCSDPVAAQAIIDAFTPDTLRQALLSECDTIARNVRNAFMANVSPAEMSSWPIKRAEATAYIETQDITRAPSLAAEAQARGVDIATLAAKVASKAQALSMLEAVIAGTCGRHQDVLRSFTTIVELRQYDFRSGWPTV